MNMDMRELAKQLAIATGRAIYLGGIPEAEDAKLKALAGDGHSPYFSAMSMARHDPMVELVENRALWVGLSGPCRTVRPSFRVIPVKQ